MGVKDLFFKITARDRTGNAFTSVNRRLRETDGLSASVSERIGRAGRSMQRFGAVGSVATLGVAAAFRDVIGLYDEQQRAEAKVAQAVAATGGAAGFAAEQLYEQASALQDVTRFGDEDILNNVTAQLLTFKNISGEAFMGAQEAALDLATVLDGDLQSASIMLGKALNDPIAGLGALSRAGVTFSEAQTDIIKELARTGDIAGAQKVILEEMASVYGDQAEAARQAGAGIVDAWANIWGDVKEVVGGVLVEILPPILDSLKAITGWFQSLEPEGQKIVVMFGALAIAIPPVTAALGLMAISVNALMGPVGLIALGIAGITAAAALLWPEQDKVTGATDNLTRALGDEITQSQLLSGVLGSNTQVSVDAAQKKLQEARSRHENVKAIIAENRAMALQSTDYQDLLSQIGDAEAALNSLGFPAIDVAVPMKAEAFEQAQQRLADLRIQQQEYLAAGDEMNEQLERTEENIRILEDALSDASNGVVSFGDDVVTPIEPADRLSNTLGGSGGEQSAQSLADALRDVGAAADEAGEANGWDTVKSNLRALLTEGQSWGDTWRNIFGHVLDNLFDLAFSPAWDALFENLEGYLTASSAGGSDGSGGGLLGNLFAGAGNWVGSILGLDTGGDVTVSGKAGIDRNMTILRTSDNERVSVRRQGDAMGRPVTVNIYAQDLRSFQGSQAQIAGQMRRALAAADRAA
ncbi:MAG: hypothetical protein ACK5MY_15685 [Jhaorihella sp.]